MHSCQSAFSLLSLSQCFVACVGVSVQVQECVCVNQAAIVFPVGDLLAPLWTVPMSVQLLRSVSALARGWEPALIPGTDGSHRGFVVELRHQQPAQAVRTPSS